MFCGCGMCSVEKKVMKFEGHNDIVWDVKFHPRDSGLLASASSDRTVMLWDLASGTRQAILMGHRDAVMSVDISTCGTKLASGGGDIARTDCGGDCDIRVWSIETGACEQVFKSHTGSVTQVEFLDGTTLVSSSQDGSTRVWDTSTGELKVQVSGEKFALSKAAGRDQRRGPFLVTARGDLVQVHNIGAAVAKLVALFRAPSRVTAIDCADDRIGIGCHTGAVLHLRAAWLTMSS